MCGISHSAIIPINKGRSGIPMVDSNLMDDNSVIFVDREMKVQVLCYNTEGFYIIKYLTRSIQRTQTLPRL